MTTVEQQALRRSEALASSPPHPQAAGEAGGSGAFWDAMADRYARSPIRDEASYRRKLEMTQALMRPDMEVLEVGCGTGSTALLHAPHVRHIRAADVSSRMIEIAREKAAKAGIRNVDFEQADIDTLDVAPESQDMVLALSVLHLLADERRAIGKMHDWLKPGGYLVTSTACLGDSMWFLKAVLPVMRVLGRAPRVVRFFKARALENVMTEAGFEIEQSWQPSPSKALFIVARKPVLSGRRN